VKSWINGIVFQEKLMNDEVTPAREKYFAALKKYLEKSGSGYLVGKTVTWPDIVISDNLETLQGLAPSLFDGFPEVKKFVDHINELPNLKKYKAERPAAKF